MIYIIEHVKTRAMDAIANLLSHFRRKVFWLGSLASDSCFMEGNVFSPDLYRLDVRVSVELGVELFPYITN